MLFRRVLAIVVTFTIFLQLFPVSLAEAEANVPLETNAVSAVLMEASTGKILYSKEPHKRVAPASVTKVMTLLVAVEAIAKGKVSWEDRVIASEEAWKLGGSQIWLEPGEEFSLREMLIAIAVGSANDACVAVAEHIAGSHQAFVHLMNQKAKSLGLKNTHFVNAYGLPAEDHYTSAYDMAQICRECLKYPELLELTSIKHYDKLRGGRPKLDNTNKLLWWYQGTDGFKTGWTSEAKYCLASTVKRDGLRLICCVFGVPEPRGHFRESIKIYNWGFANYAFREVASPEKVIISVPVAKGEKDKVKVGVAKKAGVVVKKGEDVEVKTQANLPSLVAAPVRKGEVLGELLILADGKAVEKVPLVAKESVPRASFWLLFKKFLGFFVA
ncbi:MAG: D-alanyl-D-alanine carboxypeptidase DacF [Thermoanaerobacterales bacterium 50_218]|nr:MAG: D-alanyl-D-alanine carboxypeptidase DacF [Thermoanaerobacterales bacterium 50_218]HAA90437.1 D-alanyl-D-alanine carboxypeptidase [Peptococcaceae bacterium]